jgi:hypothetical protein
VSGWKGLSRNVLEAAGVTETDEGLTAIPYRAVDGHTLRTRLVAPSSGRRWWASDVEGVHLFGAETLAGASPETPVLVCEGESDALAAREHLPTFLALGSPGARAFRAEWRALFERFPFVYAIGDGDDAGRDFAWRVRSAVPWTRPFVCPEGRDIRDLLQAGDRAIVLELLAEADFHARLEEAVLRAPDLATCIDWLREPRDRLAA